MIEDFIGEGGSLIAPLAIKNNIEGINAGAQIDGKEALGGLKFASVALRSKETVAYTIIIGVAEKMDAMSEMIAAYDREDKVHTALKEAKNIGRRR